MEALTTESAPAVDNTGNNGASQPQTVETPITSAPTSNNVIVTPNTAQPETDAPQPVVTPSDAVTEASQPATDSPLTQEPTTEAV